MVVSVVVVGVVNVINIVVGIGGSVAEIVVAISIVVANSVKVGVFGIAVAPVFADIPVDVVPASVCGVSGIVTTPESWAQKPEKMDVAAETSC